ncbi:nucleotidyltransferase family protein [Candidatus Micrarchaeota archaeon]|nr:nucleotidyltransferase family protein [Candidatus Micrarchaeota archaeon]
MRQHPVKRAAIFGSTAKNKAKKGSDVDILVELGPSVGLLQFIGLKQELEKKLDRKVDLVEYGTIKPALRERILSEEVSIL